LKTVLDSSDFSLKSYISKIWVPGCPPLGWVWVDP